MTMNSPEHAARAAEQEWLEVVEGCLANPDRTHLLNSLSALEHGAPTAALSRVLRAVQAYVRRVDQDASSDYRIRGEWIERHLAGSWQRTVKVAGAVRLAEHAVNTALDTLTRDQGLGTRDRVMSGG
jgi:hypothetical protein